MSILTPTLDRTETRLPMETPLPRRHPEAPDQGDLDPRRVEAADPSPMHDGEAPDAGDADLDHGRSQS